jgi:large subunit ribosomal protein L18
MATDAKAKKGTKTDRALATGKALAKLLNAKKITAAVFDAGGFTFHGRVQAVADGLRDGGIRV